MVDGLERIRSARKLSHNAFAQVLGVDQANWSRIRRGIAEPSLAFIVKAWRMDPGLWQRFRSHVDQQLRTT
jgi:predicted transcriptional regulator